MYQKICSKLPQDWSISEILVNEDGEGCDHMIVIDHSVCEHPSVLLMGHVDTVFEPDYLFPIQISDDGNTLHGPGVADMKGGLYILTECANRLQRDGILCSILLNGDEEIGSFRSRNYIEQFAKQHDFAFVFEPCPYSKRMISTRAGSANGHIHCHGRAAHAGRNPELGVHAIFVLNKFHNSGR